MIDDITIHQPNACLAYLYFDYKNREAQSGDHVIRTLLKQLLLSSDLIPRELEASYDDYYSHPSHNEGEYIDGISQRVENTI